MFCPECSSAVKSTADRFRICFDCGWSGDLSELITGMAPPSKRTQDKPLKLDSPPTCCKITTHEERYLQHCANIALIIAHSGPMLTWSEKIREYLRITEEGEMA